ncbi:hypothetical protein C8R44DRAFT_974140 [Mycena epipterygia]|nr:hypothetical protein C8R44DRAFT_974140 [Mycena epipterygia]
MARPPLSHFVWLLCFSLLSSTRADEKPCTGRNAGKYYDLNGLQAGKDYTLTTPGGHDMVLSACKSVSHETWGLKMQDPGLVGGFVRQDHGDFSMGQTNTTLSFSGRVGHPHLTLASGSKCHDENGKEIENLRGSTEIEFICDPSHGAGSPRLVAQLPPGGDDAACAWFIEWRTTAACPTSEGTTFGGVVWFLFISAVILLIAYLIIGTLYNYFVLGLAGTDALPRFTLAGLIYHGREAWEMAGDWWASSGRGSGFSSSARGPVGLGGPAGFGSRARPDVERAGSDGSFGSANGAANGAANPFIRTARKTQLQPQTNPASHQTQAMAPPSANPVPPPGISMPTASVNSMPAPAPMAAPMPHQAGALNPASHQAQLMAGMPVPHLPGAAAPAAQELQNQTQNTQYRDEAPPPTPRGVTGQTFSVGDDEGDEDEGAEVQIADIRGRLDGGGGGPVRL